MLLQRATAGSTALPSEPVLAPDRRRLATADFCAGGCDNEVAIWQHRRATACARKLAWTPPAAWSDAGSTWKRRRYDRVDYALAGGSAPRTLERRLDESVDEALKRAVSAPPIARRARRTDPHRRARPRRCAASCCARAACRRRSSARWTSSCRATGCRSRRRRSTSRASSAVTRRSCSRSASAWAKPPRRSRRRTRTSISSASKSICPAWGRCCGASTSSALRTFACFATTRSTSSTPMIPPSSLAAVHVYFPDPWPKKRHHKRRLLSSRRSCTRWRSAWRPAAICMSRPTGRRTRRRSSPR